MILIRVQLLSIHLLILQFLTRDCHCMLSFERRACRAEYLMRATRYMCNPDGTFVCVTGWDHNPVIGPDENDPCPLPVCDKGCVHGVCTQPDKCNCEVGWRGTDCNSCIPLPGCQHGKCHNESMTCHCDDGYTGGKCDRPICDNCQNGVCVHPNVCLCDAGWQGDACDQCLPSLGCTHGACDNNVPNTCKCNQRWTGPNCDQPECSPSCHPERGVCTVIQNGLHVCLCHFGYQGETCAFCTPNWACPNRDPRTACTRPNECLCPLNQTFFDPLRICNSKNLPPPRIEG